MRFMSVLGCVVLLSCAAVRDDLGRAESAFEQARYEDVEVWLAELEAAVPEMDRPDRARFYYLRGVSAFRLGEALRARHYLALCREESGAQGVGLRVEWRATLKKLMAEVEAGITPPTSGGEAASAGA